MLTFRRPSPAPVIPQGEEPVAEKGAPANDPMAALRYAPPPMVEEDLLASLRAETPVMTRADAEAALRRLAEPDPRTLPPRLRPKTTKHKGASPGTSSAAASSSPTRSTATGSPRWPRPWTGATRPSASWASRAPSAR
jgi:hypothetical protein